MAEGKLPNFKRLARSGSTAAGDDLPVGLAGGLVLLQHGDPPGQAQHLRLPGSGPADLPAAALFHPHRQRRAVPEAGQVPHPAGQAGAQAAAQVQAVLDHPRRAPDLEHRPAGADHLPARQVLRRAAGAMCVPDLLGTQGTFLLFTTRPSEEEVQGGRYADQLKGQARYETPSRGPRTCFSRAIRP